MKKKIICLTLMLLSLSMISNGFAEITNDKNDSSDKLADSWLRQSVAVVRVLNKVEATTKILKIPVGQSVRYQTLTIEAQGCIVRPPSVPFDSAAYVQVTDTKLTSVHFASWIFASEPGASVFEHPLYNISAVGCLGEQLNEFVKNQKSTDKTDQKFSNQSSEAIENSLEHSLQSQH